MRDRITACLLLTVSLFVNSATKTRLRHYARHLLAAVVLLTVAGCTRTVEVVRNVPVPCPAAELPAAEPLLVSRITVNTPPDSVDVLYALDLERCIEREALYRRIIQAYGRGNR